MALTAHRPTADPPSSPIDGAPPVLVGFADALAAPETAWSLQESGTPVVAFARRGSRPPLRRSRSVTIVEISPPERNLGLAIDDLRTVVARHRFAAVMPLDDSAVWLCNAALEASPVPIAGAAGQMAEFALDKRLQLQAAARAGLTVPPTSCLESVEELMSLSKFPLVLKPARPVGQADGRLLRKAHYICANRAELLTAARTWGGAGTLLAQPLLSGVGEGLFGLAGPNGLMTLSAHRRIRMMNPAGSGSSACISVRVNDDLAQAAARMLTEIGWRGMFMLEFLRSSDGVAWFMELNGRPWGSMALARRQGLEYPAWALKQLIDEDFQPPATAPEEGLTCRHLGRELVHLLTVLRGPGSAALTQWPPRWQSMRQVLRFNRDDLWYNLRRGDRRLFVEDTISTVLTRIVARVRT